MSRGYCLCFAAVALLLGGCSDDPPPSCDTGAPAALRSCVAAYGQVIMTCYSETGAPCADNDPRAQRALADLRDRVKTSCGDGDFGEFAQPALVGRLESACVSEASSLAWRVYGGPHGAVYPAISASGQACLTAAHTAAIDLVDGSLASIDQCLAAAGECDGVGVNATRAALANTARNRIDAECPDLSVRISIDVDTYLGRVAHQVDCLAATGHVDTRPLTLGCGPTNADFDAPRGEWKQVVVDADKWGTLCGDGSDYAFWIHLAPEGAALDRVLVGLQGGGVCVFEDDCVNQQANNPGLFTAMDDQPISLGIASDDPAESPFATWTRVYLPYCTQDVFAGGGVTEDLGSLELPRYGAVNLRAAMKMVRDVLWRELDDAGGDGYRPDQLLALFGGWSAGAYGTMYNYHWVLDDLQWPRTIAFPDAGGALDNGGALSVRSLGLLKVDEWGMRSLLPGYCSKGECAVGPVLYKALSPRLLQVPEQQMLVVSNPLDRIQSGDAFFPDDATWINAMRTSYCETRDLPGIHYYYTSVSDESLHVVTLRSELWNGTVDGERMRDWFARAIEQPKSLQDRVEEANFVADIPGVKAYPCDVAP